MGKKHTFPPAQKLVHVHGRKFRKTNSHVKLELSITPPVSDNHCSRLRVHPYILPSRKLELYWWFYYFLLNCLDKCFRWGGLGAFFMRSNRSPLQRECSETSITCLTSYAGLHGIFTEQSCPPWREYLDPSHSLAFDPHGREPLQSGVLV